MRRAKTECNTAGGVLKQSEIPQEVYAKTEGNTAGGVLKESAIPHKACKN